MNQATLLFKVLIVVDYLFNVLTGGGFQTTFSTRSYFKEQTTGTKKWIFIRKAVDRIMFEEHHCMKSYVWGMKVKEQWRIDHML